MPLSYTVPASSPFTDIQQYAPLVVAAIEAELDRPDVWDETSGDVFDATGWMEDLKLWVMENFVNMVGEVRMWAGVTVPDGWLPCDGRTVTVAEYPTLYAAIGGAFGSAPSGSFVLPDMRGRAPVGPDREGNVLSDGVSLYVPGDKLGAATVSLTAAQNGPHTHTGNARWSTTPNAIHSKPGVLNNGVAEAPQPNGGASLQYTTNSSGDGDPHNNVQPSAIIEFIIKVR